jgi:hypothetical protein
MALLCCVPALNLALLLGGDNPPVAWQRVSGVSVSIGTHDDVVKQAEKFFAVTVKNCPKVELYYFFSGFPELIFVDVGRYKAVVDPDLELVLRRSEDWAKGFMVRPNDLLVSDYICFEPLPQQEIFQVLQQKDVATYWDEVRVFRAWLFGLGEDDGVVVVSKGRVLVVKIVERSLFSSRLRSFIAARKWRPEFLRDFSKRWWTESEIAAYQRQGNKPAVENVVFGGRFAFRSFVLRPVSGKKVRIEFWWRILNKDDKADQWQIFIHFIDGEGRICYQEAFSMAGYHKLATSSCLWCRESLEYDPAFDTRVTALAFGVWHPKKGTLSADSGLRDWGNHRVVVPLLHASKK